MALPQKKIALLFQSRLAWVLSGLIPLIAFTAVMLLLFIRQQDRAIESLLRESAGNAAYMIERAIGEQVGLLKGLAASRSLDDADFHKFRLEAQRLWDMHPEWRTIILTDERQTVFNLYFPPGEPIPPLRDPKSLKIVWETQKPFLGDLVRGYMALRIPVMRNNRIVYTLVAPINPVFFKEALNSSLHGRQRGFVIAGSDGIVIAASDGAPAAKGRALPDYLFKSRIDGLSSSGKLFSAPVPISTGNWRVSVFDAVADIEAPFMKKRIAVALGSGASVILAFLIVFLLSSAWAARQKAIHSYEHMKALNEAKIRQNEAVKASNVGLYDWDLVKDRVHYSSEWKHQIGYGDDEIGEDIKELESRIHPDDLRSMLEIIRVGAVEAGEEHQVEFRLRHKDGSYRWMLAHASIIADTAGRPLRMIGSHLDITERKQAESALKESEQRFRTIADYTYDWEYWIGPDGRLIYVSPSCERVTGYAPEEFTNQPPLMQEIIHPEDAAMVEKCEREADESDAPHLIDFRIITKLGEVRWLNHICRPVYDADRRFLGKRGSNRDITVQKRLQKESIEAHRLAAIATLAGGVAHQFNNALSVITGNLELLAEDAADNETLMDYTADMKAAADRMTGLTTQLLAYARGGRYQAAPVMLRGFITDAIAIINIQKRSGIAIETDFPDEDFMVNADQPQLQMLLSAILNNAMEAVDDRGRIRIMLRGIESDDDMEDKAPDLKAGPHVCLTIADDGVGMDEETRNQLFEPFFTTKFEGRGLGMAAAYGIVQNHNGAITVESEPGKGTRVSIYLPLIEQPADEKQKAAVQKDAGPGQGTILLIEDEEGVMRVCGTMLKRSGYRVLEARTASAAVGIVQTWDGHIDLALLDVLMPDMKGDELYPRLKEHRPGMKVLVCSGFSMEGPARRIMGAGAEAFIQKPFTKQDLLDKIHEVLERLA